MTNVNDERILELRKQIETKKTNLGKTLRFTPVTNCVIELDGVKQNLQVLPKEQLVSLLVRVHAYLMSAKSLGIADQYMIGGYKAEEWIADIKSKIDIISRKEDERALVLMEEKLSKLLSDGKKVELEIDEIASLLSK
jgi:hypothetical protein